MKSLSVIKFVPYAPPHTWGLESHVAEWSDWRTKKWYWEVWLVTSGVWHESSMEQASMGNKEGMEYIQDRWVYIWYKKEKYTIIILPCIEVIPWYPLPVFWRKNFRKVLRFLAQLPFDMIHTHTRFFLTSLVGGIFARRTRKKRVHIEHWVDYVKMNSRRKTAIAYIYDHTIGRGIFRYCDMCIAISEWCKRFSQKFTRKDIPVIRRGVEMDADRLDTAIIERKGRYQEIGSENDSVRIAFIGRLVALKWIDMLVSAVHKLYNSWNVNIHLFIIGQGDEEKVLRQQVQEYGMTNIVSFLGKKPREEVLYEILPTIDIVVNPSYQEWLPTSIVEWLLAWCMAIATDVWWTPEITIYDDLILIPSWNKEALSIALQSAITTYKQKSCTSYEYVKKRFDWNSTIETYCLCFENYLNKKPV